MKFCSLFASTFPPSILSFLCVSQPAGCLLKFSLQTLIKVSEDVLTSNFTTVWILLKLLKILPGIIKATPFSSHSFTMQAFIVRLCFNKLRPSSPSLTRLAVLLFFFSYSCTSVTSSHKLNSHPTTIALTIG